MQAVKTTPHIDQGNGAVLFFWVSKVDHVCMNTEYTRID